MGCQLLILGVLTLWNNSLQKIWGIKMNVDLNLLKKLITNATPGPWAYEAHGDTGQYGVGVICDKNDKPISGYSENYDLTIIDAIAVEVNSAENASYIAAVSPDVVLALITEIERLKRLCAWDVDALQALGILPKDTRDEDMTPGLRDAAMQKLHDMEFKKLKRLEDEADWLAEYGAGKEQCPFFEFQYGDAEPIPDWCEGSETAEDGFDCPNDPVECWRKVAREAVETSNA